MLTLKPTQIIPSATVAGLSYEVRTVTQKLRFEIEAKLTDYSERAYELIAKQTPIVQEKGQNSVEAKKAVAELNQIEMEHRAPVVIREVLIGFHGLEATVEEFLERAGASLIEEAYAACKLAYGLQPEQAKNSASPSTSSSPERDEMSSTTAQPA